MGWGIKISTPKFKIRVPKVKVKVKIPKTKIPILSNVEKELRLAAERARRTLAETARRFEVEINNAQTAMDDVTETVVTDIGNVANEASAGLSRTLTQTKENFDREITWIKEDFDEEATRAKEKMDKNATILKEGIDTEATRAKGKIDQQLTRTKGKLAEEATELKKNIDREADKAKENIDRELTDFKSDVDREVTRLKSDIERELTQAKKDIDGAVKAAQTFLEDQIKSTGDTLSEGEALIREGKIVDALWHLALEPYRDVKDDYITAVSESELLSQIASTAVSYYGGPAAAAAYTAWLTYEMTGDLNASLKAGVISGLVTEYGGQVNEIKVISVESALKKSLLKACVNASAVAASGGSKEDIENTFVTTAQATIQNSSQILIEKWVETEIAPRFGKVDAPDLIPPIGRDLIDTAQEIGENLADFKKQFDNALEIGEQLNNSIEGAVIDKLNEVAYEGVINED